MNRESLTRFLIPALVFLIPFNSKKFLYSFSPHINEYFSLFLYLTDILCLIIITLFFFSRGRLKNELSDIFGKTIFVFVVLSFFSIFFAPEKGLALYHALRILLYSMTAISLSFFIKNKIVSFKNICSVFALSAFFQSVIAFFQFLRGESIGLKIFGESVITPLTTGVARVFIHGEHFLRGYGTMPHANILASFLILGLLASAFLFISEKKKNALAVFYRIASVVSFFVIMVGLVTTFSRSGWIVSLLVVGALFIYGIIKKEQRRKTTLFLGVVIIQLTVIFLLFGWAIIPRANFASGEPSVDNRILYNEIGTELVFNHPLGVGVGNAVFQAVNENLYQQKGFSEWWFWQPIHNLYILIASELGMAGLIVFLLSLYFLFFEFPKILYEMDTDFFVGTLMFLSVLVFGLFDHFMWDLPSGELIMWVSLGVVFALREKQKNKNIYEQRRAT